MGGGRPAQEAEDLAVAAVAYDGKDPYYLDTLALVKHRLGRDRDAAVDAEKAIAMDSETPGFYLRLGDIRAALGETAAARAAWQKALSLDPPNAYLEPTWDAAAIRKTLDALPP